MEVAVRDLFNFRREFVKSIWQSHKAKNLGKPSLTAQELPEDVRTLTAEQFRLAVVSPLDWQSSWTSLGFMEHVRDDFYELHTHNREGVWRPIHLNIDFDEQGQLYTLKIKRGDKVGPKKFIDKKTLLKDLATMRRLAALTPEKKPVPPSKEELSEGQKKLNEALAVIEKWDHSQQFLSKTSSPNIYTFFAFIDGNRHEKNLEIRLGKEDKVIVRDLGKVVAKWTLYTLFHKYKEFETATYKKMVEEYENSLHPLTKKEFHELVLKQSPFLPLDLWIGSLYAEKEPETYRLMFGYVEEERLPIQMVKTTLFKILFNEDAQTYSLTCDQFGLSEGPYSLKLREPFWNTVRDFRKELKERLKES